MIKVAAAHVQTKTRRLTRFAISFCILVSSSGCYTSHPRHAEITGQITFKHNETAHTKNIEECTIQFDSEPHAPLRILVRCGELGYVMWILPNSQPALDDLVQEGETIEFIDMSAQTLFCRNEDANCQDGRGTTCGGPPYRDRGGYSNLTRYYVADDSVVDSNEPFTAHGMFEFDAPNCAEGYVEFKMNVE